MPDSVTEMVEKGMTLKPPISSFLKSIELKAVRQHPALTFQAGIQLDVDSCNHSKERVPFLP